MFDLNATDGSVRKREFKSPVPGDGSRQTRPAKGNRLDSPKLVEQHRKLMGYYTHELDRQFANRVEMATDAAFYDNEQWRDEDKAQLEERGQMPLVYNVVSGTVDWVTGSEKRNRTDYKVLPRRKTGSKSAERKGQLLKYLSDVNGTPFHWSRSFEDTTKAGVGWIEDGYSEDPDKEPIYCRYESWRCVLHDSSATELDLSDARYLFRTKWVDLDIAQAMFPKRKKLLEMSVQHADDFSVLDLFGDDAMDSQEISLEQGTGGRRSEDVNSTPRHRVRLIEAWFRVPVKTQKISGGQFSGELYDPSSPGHQDDIESGEAEIVEKTSMRMFVAIMTHAGLLYHGESPYRHNRFPLTPIWAYRRDKDNLPYGMIRRLRGIQEDVNKRASKALHILSTNKVIMDEDAVDDVDELAEEIARPDAIIEVKKGKRFEFSADRDLPQWHLELMSRSINMIQSASGVTDELMGRTTNATSGIAIHRRQDQGSLATAKLFDNLRYAKQKSGEKQVSLIEQFMTEKKQFRITNMRGVPEYVDINDELPENDIVRHKADYVISEADWRASVRQAQAAELLDVIGKLAPVAPNVVMVMLDLIIESMDLPNQEELVNRIRAVTGQRDPDAEEPTPEETARAAEQAAVERLNKQGLIADIRKKMADAIKAEAEARKVHGQTIETNVSAQLKALDAALAAMQAPEAAHAADHILHESGFRSTSDQQAEEAAAVAEAARAQGQGQNQPGGQPLLGLPQPAQP
jgi:hypothetical protein